MNALEMAAILVLAALCIAWIVRDDRRTKKQQAWDDHIESIVTDTTLYPEPVGRSDETPIHTELFCKYEANRFDPETADWSQPATWKETS